MYDNSELRRLSLEYATQLMEGLGEEWANEWLLRSAVHIHAFLAVTCAFQQFAYLPKMQQCDVSVLEPIATSVGADAGIVKIYLQLRSPLFHEWLFSLASEKH